MKTRLQIRQLVIPILLVSQIAQVAHAQRFGSASGWFANTDRNEPFLTYTTREVGIGGQNVTVTHNVPYGNTGKLRPSNSYYTPPAPVSPTTNVAAETGGIGTLERDRRIREEAQRSADYRDRRQYFEAYHHVGPTDVFDGVIQEMNLPSYWEAEELKKAYKEFSVPMLRILNWLVGRDQGKLEWPSHVFEATFESSVKRYNSGRGTYNPKETAKEFRKARATIIYTLQSDPLALVALLAAKDVRAKDYNYKNIMKAAADVRETRPQAFVNFVDNVLPPLLKALTASDLESRYQLQFSAAKRFNQLKEIDLKTWPELIAKYIAPTQNSRVRTCKGLF